jgi:hypothetical protein
MIFEKIAIVLFAAAAAAALLSCNAALPPSQTGTAPTATSGDRADLQATYSETGRAGGSAFTLASMDSMVRTYAFRAACAARLGHNHVLSAPQFAGFSHLSTSGSANGRFDQIFRFDEVEIDNPACRSTLGAAFSAVLLPEDLDSTRQHLLGADNRQPDRFSLSSVSTPCRSPVRVEMHGQKPGMWIPLDVEGLQNRLSATGSFGLRQTDFGLQPFSLLSGLFSVQDEVVLDFKLAVACWLDASRNC